MTEYCETPEKIKKDILGCADLVLDATNIIAAIDDQPESARAHGAFVEALTYLRRAINTLVRLSQ